ncbi:MAG: lipoate--protein ligase family protein [Gemmataceae bacterium]
MSRIACEFYRFQTADGPTNMAIDGALLEHAVAGSVSLRFYSWHPATLSLGYFQRATERPVSLPFVRRSTGGGAIIHDHDLTYALALPADVYLATDRPWVCRIHDAIRAALTDVGVDRLACATVETGRGEFLCFSHQIPGDIAIDSHKIVGSAQRRRAGGTLIHGSVLLATSTYAPHLPGIRELVGRVLSSEMLADRIASEIRRQTDWHFIPRDVPPVGDIAAFSADDWNRRR